MSALPAMMQSAAVGMQLGTGIGGLIQSKRESKMLRAMGRGEADLARRRGRKVAGKQRAAYGKAGVRLGVGTPLEVLAETAWMTELNALREQFRFDTAAHRRRQQGRMGLMQSILGALGSARQISLPGGGGGGGSSSTRAPSSATLKPGMRGPSSQSSSEGIFGGQVNL